MESNKALTSSTVNVDPLREAETEMQILNEGGELVVDIGNKSFKKIRIKTHDRSDVRVLVESEDILIFMDECKVGNDLLNITITYDNILDEKLPNVPGDVLKPTRPLELLFPANGNTDQA